jgi:hypothetical protein
LGFGVISASHASTEQKIKALEVQLQEANEKARLLDVLKKDYGVRIEEIRGQIPIEIEFGFNLPGSLGPLISRKWPLSAGSP